MIEAVGLGKRYDDAVALADVDLLIERGRVYGLVGPNGAGKTTLLGLVAGLRRPSSGSVRIDAPAERVAVLPDTPRFDPWLTGREVVELAGSLVGADVGRVDVVVEQAGITDAADRRVGGYSRGMLQRLGVASALVGSPEVVLLDEPASALDPLGRREVLDVVARLRGEATVLFSSHILSDVQEVCDVVGVLDAGRLVFDGPLDELLVGAAVPRYLVRVRSDPTRLIEALRRTSWVTDVEHLGAGDVAVAVDDMGSVETGMAAVLAETGAAVISMGPEAASLERAFLELTR
jgi:ABC-2 type transport system ATP-binding protein